MTIVLAIALLISLCGNVALVVYFIKRMAGQRRTCENQTMSLAEANLALLEHREELEEQKLKLADANVTLLEQKEIIEEERERSEKLLLNVLPMKVATELKETGKTEPEHFENVSVYFSDIVDFTQLAEKFPPKTVISELNELFTAFDHIIEKHGCERIKTIGDAYLCVCGMPDRDEHHAENIIKSAREILEFLNERNASHDIQWRVRIGIHTGVVVGAVVGVKKYIYDVFGDTINTAARLESHSEPMRVNVSEATYRLVKDKFNFLARPPIEVKGKGTMNMYFLE